MKKQQAVTTLPIEIISSALLPSAQMPFALDIEQAVLGCLMVEYGAQMQQALLQLTPDSFYDGCTRTVFEAMRAVESSGSQIDIHTVGQRLKQDNNLAAIGGMNYLVDLTQKVGSGVHFETHVKMLLERQIGRDLAAAGYRTMCRALDGLDVADVLSEAQSDIEQVMTIGMAQSNRKHISTITEQALAQAHIRQQKYEKGEVNGVPTGFAELDRMTGGWQPSQLIILAARPAMGKTALMLHFAIAAAKAGFAACIYSLEMSAVALVDRMILSQCSVAVESYRRGKSLSSSEWIEIDMAKAKLDAMPITIDDKAGVSMRYIATHSKIMQRRHRCSIVLIDYLQMLDIRTFEKGRNREQEVAAASKAAKELAKDLGIPVIMLSQLSRAVEGRGGDKEPILSDLRDSGAIEQDADIVLFPHRPEYYTDKEYSYIKLSGGRSVELPLRGLGRLIVAKQRDGATGGVLFNCNLSQGRFWDFDERPYLSAPTRAVGAVGASGAYTVDSRPIGSGSINYVAPSASAEYCDNLPF